MSLQTIKGYLFMELGMEPPSWAEAWRPVVWHVKVDDDKHRVFIREVKLEVDVPDDFDPVPRQVAALEAEKLKALQEYQSRVAEINEQLAKLQALTYEVAA